MYFFFKMLCGKNTYNIDHCVHTIKKSFFFSCLLLYYKCIKPGAIFNLLLFSVYHPLLHIVPFCEGKNKKPEGFAKQKQLAIFAM